MWYNLINIGFLIVIWFYIFISFSTQIQKRLYWILFFATYSVIEIISIPISLFGVNNLWLYNIRNPIQFIFLTGYFIQVFTVKKVKIIIYVLVISLCLLLTISRPFKEFGSIDELIYGPLIIIGSLIYFSSVLNNDNFIELNGTEFWFCSSLFIYFGTNLCINGSMAYLLKYQKPVAMKLFYGFVLNSYLFYVIILYALLFELKSIRRRNNG